MKLKLIFILLLIISSKSIFSQEKVNNTGDLLSEASDNGRIENGVYVCNRFDWKIDIPQGYEVTSLKRVEELDKKGFEAIKKELPNGIQIRPNPPHLIGFSMDKRNTFSSTFEPLEGTIKMTLEESKNFIATLLNDTYSKIQGIKFELNKSDLKIGKYDFYKIQVKIYNAKTDELIMTQEVYNCFVQNNLFSSAINYSAENTRQVMTDNFIKSLSN